MGFTARIPSYHANPRQRTPRKLLATARFCRLGGAAADTPWHEGGWRVGHLLMSFSPSMRVLSQLVTNLGARVALAYAPAERLLRAGIRRPKLRRGLKLGAIALGYTRVLRSRCFRIAELNGYRFWVNVAEPLGIEPYFFGRSGTAWLAPELVRPGDLCVDVGANAGLWSRIQSSHRLFESQSR